VENAVKFEVEIKKSDLGKLREFMFNCDLDPESDEDIIQELFYMTSLRREVDIRDKVKVRKII